MAEGFAVGCLNIRIAGIRSRAASIELAFGQAWHRWRYREFMPALDAKGQSRNVIYMLRSSEHRDTPTSAFWLRGRELQPHLVSGWSLNEAG